MVLNDHFESVFTIEDTDNIPPVGEVDYPFMAPIAISAHGIEMLIDDLKISISTGHDNINSKILKNTKEISSKILCLLFQQSLATGQIPTDWKIGKIIPIHKNGDRSLVANYRPISLTSVASKLLEHIIFSHTVSHLENNKFFYEKQHGFRKGFSCESQLIEFTHDIHINMNQYTQTDAIFLDFSKAFDRVPHCRLLAKLSSLHIDSLTLSWIRNFLTL